mgnify:CR=1 FL=1
MLNYTGFIKRYYKVRGLTMPDTKEALDFAITEWAEARELLFAEDGKRVRNHEQEPYSDKRFAEELGDVILMAIVAGMTRGLDPLQAMVNKLDRKMTEAVNAKLLKEAHAKNTHGLNFTDTAPDSIIVVDEEDMEHRCRKCGGREVIVRPGSWQCEACD